MADYPYEVPPGYTEGMSGGSYNPETGQRTSFALPPQPVRPAPPAPSYELNVAAANDILKSEKADEALKRIQAAQYFLGSQMLKKALDSGNSKDAMQATMLMFPKNPGAAVGVLKGLTPPPKYDFKPATSNSPAYFNPQNGGKPVVVPGSAIPKPAEDKVIYSKGGIWRVPATGTNITTLREPEPKPEPTPYTVTTGSGDTKVTRRLSEKQYSAEAERQRAEEVQPLINEYLANQAEMRTGDMRTGFLNYKSRKAKADELAAQIKAKGFDVPGEAPQSIVTPPQSLAAPSAPQGQVQEVARLTKDGRKAIYDATTKKFLRYATD